MQERFLDYITLNQLLNSGDKVLLAVSGGIDSVCLAHLFNASPHSFAIAHCNFQLRGADSDNDELFVKELAEKFGVAFHTVKFDTQSKAEASHISTQMAARELRYEWFDGLMSDFDYQRLATAHHLNDSAETAIFNLTKGTGVAGLRGIKVKNERLIRPLMFAEKGEIQLYMESNDFNWREDISNQSIKYRRNYIRNSLMPGFLEINPAFIKGFAETADRLLLAEKGLKLLIDQVREQYLKISGQHIILELTPFKSETDYVLLYEVIKPYGFSLRQSREVLKSGDLSGRELLSTDYWLVKDRGRFIITKKTGKSSSLLIDETDNHLEVDSGSYKMSIVSADSEIGVSKNIAMLDFDKLQFPLIIRDWKTGEKFVPLGMKGKKKISDFMIDNKIPLNLKKTFQVLISGEKVVWLIGLRLDERFKITDSTKRIYKIEFNTSDV